MNIKQHAFLTKKHISYNILQHEVVNKKHSLFTDQFNGVRSTSSISFPCGWPEWCPRGRLLAGGTLLTKQCPDLAEAQSHGSSTCRQNQVGFGHGVRSWSPRTSLLWRNQWRPWCAGNNSASFNLPGSPLGCISMSCYFDKQHACQELARWRSARSAFPRSCSIAFGCTAHVISSPEAAYFHDNVALCWLCFEKLATVVDPTHVRVEKGSGWIENIQQHQLQGRSSLPLLFSAAAVMTQRRLGRGNGTCQQQCHLCHHDLATMTCPLVSHCHPHGSRGGFERITSGSIIQDFSAEFSPSALGQMLMFCV